MIGDALDAFSQIVSPPFRRVMAKSLALTAAILVLAGVGLDRLALSYVHVETSWLGALLSAFVALGLVVGMIVLAPPTVSLVASFYLDDIAAIVERSLDPRGVPGRPLPLWPSLVFGLRFALLSIVVNVAVLALTIFTGVGLAAFFVLNGYLLGREYFQLAAMRHMSAAEARDLFDRHWLEVFAAGAIVAALVAVPVLNLLTPLFATAFLTRVYKRFA
ncbi:CysZ protein [Roseiarcus fermentans]|uniref:CysZ protein n=1 Tax=Roseiarcus fermentans TaxID=1473586 RepID=A0A366FTT9_9HYPH|nr:sulfate transporter family protein [Roseiarcus fermentans]RBP17155.1 CysZ protein [Roseiarcus fermentans]